MKPNKARLFIYFIPLCLLLFHVLIMLYEHQYWSSPLYMCETLKGITCRTYDTSSYFHDLGKIYDTFFVYLMILAATIFITIKWKQKHLIFDIFYWLCFLLYGVAAYRTFTNFDLYPHGTTLYIFYLRYISFYPFLNLINTILFIYLVGIMMKNMILLIIKYKKYH